MSSCDVGVRRGLALATLAAADFLIVMDGLIVAVALPEIQAALGFSAAGLQWVITAYALVFGGFLLLGGRLADLLGRRRVLVAGCALLAAGSVGAGLAPTAGLLVAGRAVQGLGAAAMAPAALALLTATFPAGRDRDRALGVWSAVGSAGVAAGALLGGLLTGSLGWRWVLLVTAPAAALAAGATLAVVPESRDEAAPRRLDVAGAVSATAGVALLILAITAAERAGGPGRIAVPLACAAALLGAFVAIERRRERLGAPALLRLGLFRVPGLLTANLAGAALPVGLGALLFLGTQHLQGRLGFSPLQTGLAYVALSVPVIVASPAAPLLVGRWGRRRVAVAGLAVQAAGLVWMAGSGGGFGSGVLPAFVLVGAGAPVAYVPVTGAAVEGAGDERGMASGVFNAAQQVGNAIALAVMASVAAAVTLDAGLCAAAAMCVLGGAAALRLRG